MEPLSSNGFGSNTYWNCSTSRSRSNRPSRSLSPAYREFNEHSTSIARGPQRPNSPSTATVPSATVSNTEHGDVKVTADPSLKLQRSRGVPRTSRANTSLHNYIKKKSRQLQTTNTMTMKFQQNLIFSSWQSLKTWRDKKITSLNQQLKS
jgi:hypothetical protein